jgi:hypothetical protein
VLGFCTAANAYSGANVAVWHGSSDAGPAKIRGYRVSDGTLISGPTTLDAGLNEQVKRIRRVKFDNSLLVATTKGRVYHLDKTGTVLGRYEHPKGQVVVADIDATRDGHLVYGVAGSAVGGVTELFYFWLPEASAADPPVGGEPYEPFDESFMLANFFVNGIACGLHEYVTLSGSIGAAGWLGQFDAGIGYCRPNVLIAAEHARLIFE